MAFERSNRQVRDLQQSLQRVKEQNRKLHLGIAYAWGIDLENYYSTRLASASTSCDLPYTRLDVHTDGGMAVCVSGKRIGQIGAHTIFDVWNGASLHNYRAMYEREKPMPMCFRCCGMSQTIRFDPVSKSAAEGVGIPVHERIGVRKY